MKTETQTMNNENSPIVMTAVVGATITERVLTFFHQIPEMLAPLIAIGSCVAAVASAIYWCRKLYRERKRK